MTKDNPTIIKFQQEMKRIRGLVNVKGAAIGRFLGLSRQNICNLESGSSKLSVAQYIALRVIFERLAKQNDVYEEYGLFMSRRFGDQDWLDDILGGDE